MSLAALGSADAQEKAAKLSDEQAKQVAAMIKQLDSKKFAERERAMKALGEFGRPALALLEKAEKGPVSLETRRRLSVVIWKLRAPTRAEVARRVAVLIPQLSAVTFREREGAMNELLRIGRPALDQLYQATLAPDIETVRRAEVVIGRILNTP
jgi:hypothetical protein